ncbi:16S rRNA (adenine(1518)-N(6)/adenine(1519)-N(6))-dimethyltransferase RsmA [Chloroflexota bacterium]
MTDLLLRRTKGILRRFDLKSRKSLGQNFLIDMKVLEKVVLAAELTTGDSVIEVGPGLGVLTRELAQRAGRVIAVEKDDRLAAVLKKEMADSNKVSIINRDILKINPIDLLGGQAAKYKVVANLPYYITSAVLRHFLEASPKPEMMVVMLQKEVAEGIAAADGRMSLLSISVWLYGRPQIIDYVPAAAFHPQPKVDSAILKISVYSKPAVAVDDIDGFFNLVRAGFSASRKQLPNSLASGLGLSKTEILPLLEAAGIMQKRRAETLALEEWYKLWRIYNRRQDDKTPGAG